MRRHNHTAAVRMAIALMRSGLTDKIETIACQGCNHFSGRQRTETTVIEGHGLDRDRDAGILPGNLLDLDGTLRAFWQRLALLHEFLDEHVNHLIDIT